MEATTTQQHRQQTPQQIIQSANILQMTVQELYTYLQETALENPVMEIREPSGTKDHTAFESSLRKRSSEQYLWLSASDDSNRYLYEHERQEQESENLIDRHSVKGRRGALLADILWEQLVSIPFRPKDAATLKYILASLDSWGYLREPLEDISEKMKQPMERLEQLLAVIQALDPPGVGARDLSECLLLQLKRRMECPPQLEFIVANCLDQLAKNQIPAIAKKAGISVKEASRLCQIIRGLNPKPGAFLSNEEIAQYVLPDILVIQNSKGSCQAQLNDSMCPKIEICQYYCQLSKTTDDEEVRNYLQDKIGQIKLLRSCVTQRNETLLSVASAILEAQEEFFQKGPSGLKPLRISDIAKKLGVHESIVSRAIRNKYLQCGQGIFPLTYFFSSKLLSASASTSSDQENPPVSTEAAKTALQMLIRQEDKSKPLSDRILSEKLENMGIPISRRTVAKYRECLGIPDASGRKDYSRL